MSDPEFDRFGGRYTEVIERSIGFGGRDHDFYLAVKAQLLVDLLRRRLGDPGRLSVLDVGCGEGLFDRHLSEVGRLEGVDVSEAMVAAARKLNPERTYSTVDGGRLLHAGGTFDAAFAVSVVHHVPPGERDSFVAELARVVRPGGLIVLFEHNPLNPLTRLAVARCEFDQGAELLGLRGSRRLLRRAGVEPVEQGYFLFVPWRARRLERALSRVPLGAQYYVAGTARPAR